MNLTEEEKMQELIESAKLLVQNRHFKEVIQGDYIDRQGLALAKSFNGSEADIEALKAISNLNQYLNNLIEQ